MSKSKFQPVPVKLGDSPSMLRAMEDAVETLMGQKGYMRDFQKRDRITGLGATACFFCAVAQLWPGKWPKNYWLSVVCVIVFAICQGLMELLNQDPSLVFNSAPNAKVPISGRVHVTVGFPKYTSKVKLIIRRMDTFVPKFLRGPSVQEFEHEFSVGDVFDEKGYVVKGPLGDHLDLALKGFAREDTKESKKKK